MGFKVFGGKDTLLYASLCHGAVAVSYTHLAKIVLIPQERLYPVVLMMCTVGAYATLNGKNMTRYKMCIRDSHLHAAADLTAHGLRGDAVAGQHLQLPLGSGAAVAAHGGHDEGAVSYTHLTIKAGLTRWRGPRFW